MKRMTGDTYTSTKYAKSLFLAEGKVGKTSYLAASLLGVLPWQRNGGVVSNPGTLSIITFDSSALGGLAKFLTKTCGAPAEALKFNVYNFEDDAKRVANGQADWDFSLYNGVAAAVDEIQNKASKGGVNAVLVSSLTGVAQAIQRGLQGPFGAKKGTGMDQAKWAAFSTAVAELRNKVQVDNLHALWEAHVYVTPSKDKDDDRPKESLQIDGKTGQNFAYNVSEVFRIRRRFGKKFGSTNCDEVFLDTQPTSEVICSGRGFNETLDKTEPDLTAVYKKLGYSVGAWGAKKTGG